MPRSALNLNDVQGLREREPLRPFIALLERVGKSDEHVIISGSPDLDKEWVARFIHAVSPRHAWPFVIYAAQKTRPNTPMVGRAESVERIWADATGGTLFIVDLYDLADGDQAQLLRFLESRDSPAYLPATRHSPVRVIAATRGDLAVPSHPENFRSSLFHRLNVMSVYIPPEIAATLDSEDDPPSSHLTFKEQKTRLLEAWEPEYLRELLYHVGGNLALAARTAGIARAHLYRLMKKHGLAR